MAEFYTRKQLRLPYYQVLPELTFFITVCVENREKLICEILPAQTEDELPQVVLTREGRIADQYLRSIPGLDCYVIMPNHVHMILRNREGESISGNIRSFKTLSTKEIGRSVWQRSFYDHAIRDEQDYLSRRKYLEENPVKWSLDKYYQK